MESEKHEIRTIADFFRVPAERRAVLLREFGIWMDTYEAMHLLLGDALKNFPPATFSWIDDDLGQAHVSIVKSGTGEVLAQDVVPLPEAARHDPR